MAYILNPQRAFIVTFQLILYSTEYKNTTRTLGVKEYFRYHKKLNYLQRWARDTTDCSSYISASYVKYIEDGGGRVVPVLPGESDEYYVKLCNSINGILIQGGGRVLTCSRFAKMAAKFLNWSRTCSERGIYFPIWGICMGLQQIIIAAISPDVDLDADSPENPIVNCTGNFDIGSILRKGPDWVCPFDV